MEERTLWYCEDWAPDEEARDGYHQYQILNGVQDGDRNHAVTVYLPDYSDAHVEQQIDRLIALLDRVAPDGVIPAQE